MEAISETRNRVAKAMEVTSFLDRSAKFKSELAPDQNIKSKTISGSHILE
jgi:hypothetical protein